MKPLEIVEVEDIKVACDGDTIDSGHPRVFLNMGDDDHVDCPYCGCRFVLKPGARARLAAGH